MLYSHYIGFIGYIKNSQILPFKLKNTSVAMTVMQHCFNLKRPSLYKKTLSILPSFVLYK